LLLTNNKPLTKQIFALDLKGGLGDFMIILLTVWYKNIKLIFIVFIKSITIFGFIFYRSIFEHL